MNVHTLKKINIHKHSFQKIVSKIRSSFRKKKIKNIFISLIIFSNRKCMSLCSYKLPSIFFSSVSSFLQKKIKTINEFVSSLYNLKACQILSIEINKIEIHYMQNASELTITKFFSFINQFIAVMLTFSTCLIIISNVQCQLL